MLKTKQKVLMTAALTMIMLWAFGLCVFAAPATPTGLKQSGDSERSVTIEWNKVSEARYYIIELSQDQKNWAYDNYWYSNKNTIYQLNTGSTYFVRVRASDSLVNSGSQYDVNNTAAQDGISAASAPLAVVTAPTKPSNLRQTGATPSSVTLEWNAQAGATSYEIYSGKTLLGSTASTKITLNNISPSTTIGYNVYSIRKSPTYTASSDYYSSIYAKTAPNKISGVGLYRSSMNGGPSSKYQYCIDWDYTSADGYQVEWRDQKGKLVKRTEAGKYSLSSTLKLPSKLRNKAFKVRVRGFVKVENDIKGYGEWSAYKVIVPYAQITSTKLTSKKGTDVKITWKKISGAKTYTIYRGTSLKGKFKKIGTVKNNSYVIKKNKKYRTYYVYVLANKVKVGKKRYNTTKGTQGHDTINYWVSTRYY